MTVDKPEPQDYEEHDIAQPPERKSESVAPAGPRTPAEIRENDILSFIVGVRKLSCQTVNIDRNMRQIKNMANVIFRHYIGYTAKSEYRIKHRKERCFSDEIRRLGLEDPFDGAHNVTSSEKVGRVIESVSDSPESVPVVDLTNFIADSVVAGSSLVVEEYPEGTLSENCCDSSENSNGGDLSLPFSDDDLPAEEGPTFSPDGTVTFGDDDLLTTTDDDAGSAQPATDNNVDSDPSATNIDTNKGTNGTKVAVNDSNKTDGVDKQG